VVIDGSTLVETPGGGAATSLGGLLAQGTNIGNFEEDTFSAMPELGLRVNYEISDRWRATVGYSLIYWSQVARAGEQIDSMLNLSQLPPGPLTGAPLPAFRFVTNDFWAQGLDVGVELHY
jgi:hypothetical protein